MLNKRRSGLGSLIPGADLALEGSVELAPISSIAVNPFQPRRTFDPKPLEELADSIRHYGILQPLTVRRCKSGYELIAGERRLQAARKAGLTEVPVVIRECDEEGMLVLALVENLQREDLNAIEAAHSYDLLSKGFGFSQAEVAERVGKSRSAVTNAMRLLSLPTPIRLAVADGRLSEGHGRALLSITDPDLQAEVFKETLAKGLTVRAIESYAPKSSGRRKEQKVSPTKSLDPDLQMVQEALQITLGTRVRFKPGSSANGGAIEIEYYSIDDLSLIYDKLTPKRQPDPAG